MLEDRSFSCLRHLSEMVEVWMPNSTVEVGLCNMELLRYCLGSLPNCRYNIGQLTASAFMIDFLEGAEGL